MKKIFFSVMIVTVLAILFYGIRYIQSPVGTIDAKLIVYEQTAASKAFFVRDEVVYTSDTFGTIYNHYTEGSRINNGALISTVYSGTVSDETMQELKTIDKKIEGIQQSGKGALNFDSSSVSIESLINNYKDKIIEAGDNNDISSISTYKQIINSVRSGTLSQTADDVISELEAQKQMVENRIGVSKSDIHSGMSGVFTTVLDGLENYLTPQRAMEMSVADFEAIRPNNSETVGAVVNAGESICKVSNNHEWYVLVSVKASDVSEYKEGSTINMRFDSIPGEQTECKILHKSEEQDGNVLLFLVSYYYLEGAYSFRQSNATLVLKSYTGYKVPVHAIRTQDNIQGVLAQKNNEEKFYPCKVLYTNTEEGFAIINDAEQEPVLEGIDRIVVGER